MKKEHHLLQEEEEEKRDGWLLTLTNLNSRAIFLNCCNGFCSPVAILAETRFTAL